MRETLKPLIQDLGSLRVMEPAELEVRQDLDPFLKKGLVTFIPHEGWLTVEPNVLAMGTFGTGPLMTTKPYLSGAAYIHRMSDFCTGGALNPKTNCPITNLCWAFFDRHKKKLQSNPRLMLPLRNLQKQGQATIGKDRQIFTMVQRELEKSASLTPGHLLFAESV